MEDLQGTTLRVYLYILRTGKEKVGVREVMRGMGMKSPSHAYYHLDKLVHMGLLDKRYGDYYVKRDVKIDYLRDFVFMGRYIVPRLLFLSVFFLVILIYSLLFPSPGQAYWYISLMASLVGATVSLFEALRSYRRLYI